MSASEQEKNYLWDHFKFNADQRLKAFNFFVVLSVFANGGLFAAFDKNYRPELIAVIGLFVVLLALTFSVIDYRSQHLTFLATTGLKAYEEQLPEHSRLFHLDEQRRWKWLRYTTAFYTLYAAQLMFGLGVVIWAIRRSVC